MNFQGVYKDIPILAAVTWDGSQKLSLFGLVGEQLCRFCEIERFHSGVIEGLRYFEGQYWSNSYDKTLKIFTIA